MRDATTPTMRPGETERECERRLRAEGCSRAEAKRAIYFAKNPPPAPTLAETLRHLLGAER